MKFLNNIDGANRLIEDANHRLVSDIEKARWDGKADGAHNQAISTITNLQTELDKKILLDDTIQNTNPFGGRKLYINTLDNALSGADKKYYVTVTLHKKVVNSVNYPKPINIGDITLPQWEDSPIVSTLNASGLFNNAYEGGINIPSDSYAKIRLDFNESGTSYFSGYPYGTYYLSYYYTQTPLNAQVRCYNGFASHNIGYKTLNFSNYIGTNTSGNYIQHCPDNGNYQRREIEFIIIGHDSHSTTLTQIEWKLSRPDFAKNTPIFSNYGANKSYQMMYFGNQSSNNITLNPNGDISALTFSGTLSGNANTATKLATARTINGVSFDGSANITIADSTKEPAFTKNTAFNKNFGTTDGTVCQGNDSRLSNARTPLTHSMSSHSDINQSLLTTDTVQFAKVGVGTATPNESVDIVGNARVRSEGSMKFGGTGANDAAFEIKYNNSTKSLDFNFLL